MSHFSYDTSVPVTRHSGLAAELYSQNFQNVETVLNVAAGGTNLGQDLAPKLFHDVRVVSVDPVYARQTLTHRSNMVAGLMQELPFRDESFDAAMLHFGMEYIPRNEVGATIHEMLRVVKPTGPESDGVVLINPAYKSRRLQRALHHAGFDEMFAGVIEHDAGVSHIEYRRHIFPTLIIQKTPALTAEREVELAALVQDTQAMHRIRLLGMTGLNRLLDI
jgi:ubiquinone/menaquinone biosynthesis C-methylase UbiE